MLGRLFPARFDHDFAGHRAALWVLGLLIALKLAMALNAIFNTAEVATGADGIPLESFGPAASQAVQMFFALWAVGQLALCAVAIAALVRYRAMIPFVYVLLIFEHLVRRFVVQSYAVERTEAAAAAFYVNAGLLLLLVGGLALSLLVRARRSPAQP